MRQQKTNDESSLDLLLDTICNMFGGITLIAILLAVLSIMLPTVTDQEKQVEAPSPTPSADNQIEVIDVLKSEINRREALVNQEAFLDLHQINEEIAEAEASLDSQDLETLRLRGEISQLKENIRSFASVIREQEQALEELREEAKKEREVREARHIRLPRLREAERMIPAFVAIKDGKFYEVSALDPYTTAGRDFSNNDIEVSREPGGLSIVELRPDRGISINENFARSATARRLLQNVRRDREFFSIALYENSYREGALFISLLVRNNKLYNWARLDMDEPLQIVPAESPQQVQ